jgi:peptidyl-prolyl cis-trans isomerase SurA
MRTLITIFLLAAVTLTASAQDTDEVLVRVNGHPITREDLERHLMATTGGVELAVDPDVVSAVEARELQARRERYALQALIESRILYEEAVQTYLDEESMSKVTEDIGRDQWNRFVQESGSRLKAMQRLASLGLTAEAYRRLRVQAILVNRLLLDKVYEHVNVSPRDIRQYYEAHADEFEREPKIVYHEIVFTVLDEDDRREQRRRADAAMEELREGTDFETVAGRYSDLAEMYPGGLREVPIPLDRPGYRPPAVENLAPGVLSGVRDLGDSLVIARVDEVVLPGKETFEVAQRAIRARLLNEARRRALDRYISHLRQTARIEYLPRAEDLRAPDEGEPQ